jgi:hypothetical protein
MVTFPFSFIILCLLNPYTEISSVSPSPDARFPGWTPKAPSSVTWWKWGVGLRNRALVWKVFSSSVSFRFCFFPARNPQSFSLRFSQKITIWTYQCQTRDTCMCTWTWVGKCLGGGIVGNTAGPREAVSGWRASQFSGTSSHRWRILPTQTSGTAGI